MNNNDNKDNKIALYANGFSFLVSRDSGEGVLTFTQNQPKYDETTGKFEQQSSREVTTIIIPYSMVKGLYEGLGNAIAKEEAKIRTKQ